MKMLIAEDDLVSRRVLRAALSEWGYEVVEAADGVAALRLLQGPDAPRLAVLDWMMPGLDGVEVCRQIRAQPTAEPPYLILLTGRGDKDDIVAGLTSGANDYIAKPYDRKELHARVGVGRQVVELQASLAARVRELEEALAQVKHLQGLLPICSYCKKVRDDQNYWQQVEDYIADHSEARFSHGICPECWEKEVKPQLEQATRAKDRAEDQS
jgi:DNA-binding response OmpR family regulator